MTVGARRAHRSLARGLEELKHWEFESALLIHRAPELPDVVAATIDQDIDAREIARIARKALGGDVRARATFSRFNPRRLSSLGRTLVLTGDQEALDRGIDVLRAELDVFGSGGVRQVYRNLLAEALVFRRRFDEAAEYLEVADLSETQERRQRVAIHNPFRDGNPRAIPLPAWLRVFNSFMNPSGDLAPIELNESLDGHPFDRLWSAPEEKVQGPLVTVVMSTFRRDATILGAIHSILNQTWASLEILVIDDDSGPEYALLLDTLEELDPRIRVVRQRVNGGTYLVRNRALTLARGEFITFQDSDDWSHPERIERQVRALLDDAALVASQSSCVRTDEYLDPVQVGYHKYLRRNESSLMFRARAVRRVGFFHYTRKGGDSEYRLRLEAAYDRPTQMVGVDPLAIVRMTVGSLSRSEFAPGFRHPRRLVYTQGYSLVHQRARDEGVFYRPLAEYTDPFVPATFRPRQRDHVPAPLDVIVTADLRTCAGMEQWITSTVTDLSARGLSVGLAQYTGLRVHDRRTDLIAPEVAALLVDEVAESVDLADRRDVGAVLVADAALLQHKPWGSVGWCADRVYVRRMEEAPNESVPYDDATVASNCRALFRRDPVWTADEGEAIAEIAGQRLGLTPSESPGSEVAVVRSDVRLRATGSASAKRWTCRVDLTSPPAGATLPGATITTQPRVPWSVAQDEDIDQWCAVVGWPHFGLGLGYEEGPDPAEALLKAWRSSDADFEEAYGDLGGDCVVIRGNHGDAAIRATAQRLTAERSGDAMSLIVSSHESGPFALEDNSSELVLPELGEGHLNPLQLTIRYDGPPLDELQQLIDYEASSLTGQPTLALDDDLDSAAWLGLLRDRVEDLDLVVRAPGSRVARFLEAHFISVRTDRATTPHPSPLALERSASERERAGVLQILGTSLRARTLARLVVQSMGQSEMLEAIWHGLSSVPSPEGALLDEEARRSRRSTAAPKWVTNDVQDARDVSRLQLPPRQPQRIGVRADLARSERFPLSATFTRGESTRLVVELAPGRVRSEDGYPVPTAVEEAFPDHHLVLADTTFAEDPDLDYGWFFGTPGNDLLRRWSTLTTQLARQLGSKDVVVHGDGRAALPAVLLASYLPDATAVITDPESEAGESSPEAFDRLSERLVAGGSDPALVEAWPSRLRLQDILDSASSRLRVVVAQAPQALETRALRELTKDPRVRFEPVAVR